MQNKDGQYPQPDNATFQAAAAYADWKNARAIYQIITNSPGTGSVADLRDQLHPAAQTQDKPANGQAVLQFFDWSFKNGNKMADELDYVPLPDALSS